MSDAATTTEKRTRGRWPIGPYSKRLRRGVIADNLDGRSVLGRFCRDLEQQLIEHVGGAPSVTQRILINRVVKIHVQIDTLDEKISSGSWTDHDARTYGGLQNALRLSLRELGLKPASAKPPDPTTALHAHLADRGAHGKRRIVTGAGR